MWIVWKKEEEESSSMPSKSNHGRNKKKIALSQQSRTDGRTHQTEDEYCRVERQAKLDVGKSVVDLYRYEKRERSGCSPRPKPYRDPSCCWW
eukprot:scaffold5238_cov177-Amphora_coffeaeformis.AAC.3